MAPQVRSIGELGLGTAKVRGPGMGTRGVRVAGVTLHGDALVFRAEGGVAPGIYVEDGKGAARLLLPDGPNGFHVTPVAAGPLLAVHRARPGRIPPVVEELVFIFQGADVMRVPGQTVGVSGDGRVALVADVLSRSLHRVDLMNRRHSRLAEFDAGMHPHLAPVLSLNRDGSQALFMDARDERCDGSLELLDMRSGERQRLCGPLDPPGRVCGAFVPGGRQVVMLEMRMADGPRFVLSLVTPGEKPRTLLELPLAQPLSAPAFINEHVLALPLSLTAHEGATYGPIDLVAVDLRNGQTHQLTRNGEVHGRARVADGTLLVEGGPGVLSIGFSRPD